MMGKSISGTIGGITTSFRYGKAQMKEWGKLGGRPRLPDIRVTPVSRLLSSIERRGNQQNRKEAKSG